MPIRNVQSTLRQWVIENDRQARAELTDVAYEMGIALTQKPRDVVRNWEGKPTFAYRVTVDPRFIRVTVFPKGQYAARYRFIDLGTKKPYTITARNVPYLHFKGGYDQKTLPIAKYNVGLGGNTGDWAKKKSVEHPGIKAREFSKTFIKNALPEFRRKIVNAIRRALRRKG